MAQNWDIQKFISNDGRCRFDEWFNALNQGTQARVDRRLDRVAMGNFGDHKALKGGLFELRLMFGPGYRIYYGMVDRTMLLLLVGGDKATQKKDIDTARRLWNEFRDEKGE